MINSNRRKIGELLIEVNMITPEQLEMALEKQKVVGKKLGEILIEENIVSERDVIQVLEFQLGIPHVELDKYEVKKEAVFLVNHSLAKKYCLIPIKVEDNTITVAMSDPLNIFAIDDIKMSTGLEVKPVIATTGDIIEAIDRMYTSNTTNKVAAEILEEMAIFSKKIKIEDDDDSYEVENSPAVKLINSILDQGIKSRASDIHVEPFEEFVKIRFRIDGELVEHMRTDAKTLSALVTRIKIMAKMNIAENRIPQDGRIQFRYEDRDFDLRASSLPTVFGEKIVIRLAEKKAKIVSKVSLGFNKDDLKKFDELLKNPHGIILVTGPTGSGKSTTLYTALRELNQPTVNIVTVEDPVENVIEGINQVNVNSKAGLTFANVLRSILRQDPDIVMIGEIRDSETVGIAVKAAITGHLVLSTIHTNDAPSTINRLIDMGVEPFMLSSAIVGIIAQRLVRKICPHCKYEFTPSQKELEILGKVGQDVKLYRGKGCSECNEGYRDRIGLYEILIVNKEIREAISEKCTSDTLRDICVANGMKQLKHSGFELVLKGKTTIEEVLKVSYENQE